MSSYTLRLLLLVGGLSCSCASSLWGQNKNTLDSTVQVQSNGDTIITYSASVYDWKVEDCYISQKRKEEL